MEDNEFLFVSKKDLELTISFLKAYKVTIDNQITTIKAFPFQKKLFNELVTASNELSLLLNVLNNTIKNERN